MKRFLRCVVIVVAIPTVAAAGHAQSPVFQARGLREYIGDVLVSNAAYAAARAHLDAAGERIAPAGALPNPTLALGVMSVPVPSFDFTAERMTRIPVGLEQRFPFPGKQAAGTALARADSSVASELLGTVESELVVAASELYYELAYAVTALDLWRARVSLADQAVAVTHARYETGAAPQTDVLRARLRRAELEEERPELEAGIARVRAQIDALRGGPGDSVPSPLLVTRDGRPSLRVEEDSLVDDTLVAQLRHNSPILQLESARVRRAERNARVFDVAARPDFTVALIGGIRFGGREPFLTALVAFSVPLWAGRNQSPAARAAHLEVEAARQRHEDLAARLTGELKARLADLAAFRERTRQTLSQILPIAEVASVSALQQYAVGAAEFTAVLDTQDNLFLSQLKLARLIADYGVTRAWVAALVGEEWYT